MTQIHRCRDLINLPSPSPSPYHIFFLPGNPGLVEYYAKFLSLLHSTLNQATSTTQFNIAGCSYAGFETEPVPHSEENNDEHKLYDITEQVDYSLGQLQEYINCTTKDAKTKPKVILIGHSFGTFIIAELLKRLYTPSTEEKRQNYEIIGNIHLFPPIPDLAKSPRGVKAAVLLPSPPLPFFFGE
jgi:pimeloyl-ACP methyl ester carboxylesterase